MKNTFILYCLLAASAAACTPGKKATTVWAEVNRSVAVPVGKWFTTDYYLKEGGRQDGRFYLAITPEGGRRQVVFDLTRITHNTQDQAPDGIGDFNPLKLYTSKDLIKFMQTQGKTLQVYWDDLRLWKDKRPG